MTTKFFRNAPNRYFTSFISGTDRRFEDVSPSDHFSSSETDMKSLPASACRCSVLIRQDTLPKSPPTRFTVKFAKPSSSQKVAFCQLNSRKLEPELEIIATYAIAVFESSTGALPLSTVTSTSATWIYSMSGRPIVPF